MRRGSCVAVLLLVVCGLIYGSAVTNGLVTDEFGFLLARERLFRDWQDAPRLFLMPWPHFAGAKLVYYRPLVLLSFVADYHLWGLRPGASRMVNVVLHSANSTLVFLIAKSAFARPSAGLVAALLFACHPLRVETVAAFSFRPEAFHGFFWLLALYLFVRCRGTVGREATACYVGSLASLVAALLSKETAITLPLALAAVDLWGVSRGGESRWRRLARHIPFWALAITYLALRVTVLFPVQFENYEPECTHGDLAQALNVFALYVQLIWFPLNLYLEYPLALISPLKLALVVSAVLLACAFLVATLSRLGGRRLVIATAWVAASLLPLYPTFVGRPSVNADRFLYLPGVGVALILGLALDELGARGRRSRWTYWTGILGLALVTVILYTTLSSRHARFWKDNVAYQYRALQGSPRDVRIQCRWALSLSLVGGRHGTAATRLERLVQRHPDSLRPRQDLARVLLTAGEFRKAIPHLECLVKADPSDPKTRMALASAYSALGRYPEVEVELKAVIAQDPGNTHAREGLARLHEHMNHNEEAVAEYQALLRLGGDPARRCALHRKLAALYAKMGKMEDAEAEARKANAAIHPPSRGF